MNKKGKEKLNKGQQKARNHKEPRTGSKYKKETHKGLLRFKGKVARNSFWA
jgi:hypothetical protein